MKIYIKFKIIMMLLVLNLLAILNENIVNMKLSVIGNPCTLDIMLLLILTVYVV